MFFGPNIGKNDSLRIIEKRMITKKNGRDSTRNEQPRAGKSRLHDEWYTPQFMFDAAREVMGGIRS